MSLVAVGSVGQTMAATGSSHIHTAHKNIIDFRWILSTVRIHTKRCRDRQYERCVQCAAQHDWPHQKTHSSHRSLAIKLSTKAVKEYLFNLTSICVGEAGIVLSSIATSQSISYRTWYKRCRAPKFRFNLFITIAPRSVSQLMIRRICCNK